MKEKYVLWFRNGLETISYHAPQLWTIFLEELKQRNTTSLFKSDMKQQICKIYIYMYYSECELNSWPDSSGQLSLATSNNPSMVNTIYIYIYIYI